MNRSMAKTVLVFALGAQTLLFQNCSNTKFTPDNTTVDASSIGPDSCQPGIIETNRNVKLLMVIDTSGSNLKWDSAPGTDPQRKWRLQAMNSLINRYSGKNNFHFGLTIFHHDFSKAQIRTPAGQAVFTNSSAMVQQGLTNFNSIRDEQGTPYGAALSLAYSMIKNDLKLNPQDNALYSVVFVSDGMPDDAIKSPEELIPMVSSITALAPGRVNLNTVFYYSSQLQKEKIDTKYLQTMSRIGQGTFVTADATQSIQLDDKIAVSSEACN